MLACRTNEIFNGFIQIYILHQTQSTRYLAIGSRTNTKNGKLFEKAMGMVGKAEMVKLMKSLRFVFD